MADSSYSMHLGEADAERLELLIVSSSNYQFSAAFSGSVPPAFDGGFTDFLTLLHRSG